LDLHLGLKSIFRSQSLLTLNRTDAMPLNFQPSLGIKMPTKAQGFFLLLLHDKFNTRERLMRRHMELELYTCENWFLQRIESSYHLFLRCNFAERYWSSIGITTPTSFMSKNSSSKIDQTTKAPML
jgi:hypothetical protein